RVGQVCRRYPLVNAAASPREYESDGRSMFAATRDIDRLGLETLAVYHSHPTSEPIPSKTDRERNYSTDVMNLIISLKDPAPSVRAWWLTADDHQEAEWELTAGIPPVPLLEALPHPDRATLESYAQQVMDWALGHFATLPEQLIGRRASRQEMEALLREP